MFLFCINLKKNPKFYVKICTQRKIRDAEMYFFPFTNDFFYLNFSRHKRKVQNFLPCKTPTRGVHLDPNGLSGGHSVTYEDPDAHLGHRPLVMRHHHNIEVSY